LMDFAIRIDVDSATEFLAFIHEGEVLVATLASREHQPPRKVGSHENAFASIFHPTEPIVVSASHEPPELRFWSLAEDSDGPIRTLEIEPFSTVPEFDPTGRYLAVGSENGKSRVWDLEAPPDANPVSLVRSNADVMMSTSFHPYDPWLVTADQAARTFWSLNAPWPLELHGHDGRVTDLVFDPEGRWLLSSAQIGSVARIWPLEGTEGGIEAWLQLGEAVGLTREELHTQEHVLPGVRFAIDAYVNFGRRANWQEAACSSLTELFAPRIHQRRLDKWPEYYPWIRPEGYHYFRKRLSEARRDVQHGLNITLDYFKSRDQQEKALDILQFKLNVLWTMLDAMWMAYIEDRPPYHNVGGS